MFRTFPKVKRSYHPCFSFSAWGQDAEYITSNHSLDYGLGENSPLGKFYKLGGKVLLIGVNYDRNTSFHLSEVKSGIKDEFTNGAPILVEGKRVWKKFKDIEFDSDVFNQIGKEFEKDGEVINEKIGQADSKLFDQPEAVDFATNWIIKNDK